MSRQWVVLSRPWFLDLLAGCLAEAELAVLRQRLARLKETVLSTPAGPEPPPDAAGDVVWFRQDVLLSELDQALTARTLQRARYYLRRLVAGVQEVRTSRINDINLRRWHEYDDILTDSLWFFGRRDVSGAHLGWYWGNFVPQIPHQLLLRYSKRGEWVLDPFLGSGTTLIECRRLGRNGLGVELNPEVAGQARQRIALEPNRFHVATDVVVGDSTASDFSGLLRRYGVERVQLVIMHPPYHDIIRFSQDERDLSNAPSVEDFLGRFGAVLDRTCPILDKGRYLAVVIGDKYARGEWIPLGFHVMQAVLRRDYTLKSIVVKNYEETRAKRQRQALWRYRALAGGFYVFKHEYILLFRKR